MEKNKRNKHIGVGHIKINDNGQNIRVAVPWKFKRKYESNAKSLTKAQNALNEADTNFSSQTTFFGRWFANIMLRNRNAQANFLYKQQKQDYLDHELNDLVQEAKENPYEQELKLRYPSLKTPKDIVKYKNIKKGRIKRIAFIYAPICGILITASLLTGGIPILPAIGLAILGARFLKNKSHLKTMERLEVKKMEYDRTRNIEVNPNNNNNVRELSIGPKRNPQRRPSQRSPQNPNYNRRVRM